MQEISVNISVLYRSDGVIKRSELQKVLSELLLKFDRQTLFANGATFAGYSVNLVNKKSLKVETENG